MNYEKHKTLEKALHNLKAIFDAIPKGKQMKVNRNGLFYAKIYQHFFFFFL